MSTATLFRLVPFALIALPALATVEGWTPRTHEIPRAQGEIVIDGELDEDAWKAARSLSLDYEVSPGENVSPPVETELLLLWDEEALYFACRCRDSDPGQIRARLADRDQGMSDDWIGIMVDTFNDSRRGYEFIVTPLGVQFDALNDDVGGNYDSNWNAIWESAGKLTDFGYQVEARIPYHQLRFPATDGPLTWGFDSFRSVPRVDRHHIGLWPRDRGSTGYIVQADEIVGMEGADPGRNLEIVPTLTARGSEARSGFPNGDFDESSSDVDPGLTGRWGITPNLTLQGALNPDFSQIEADALQLDINEQFALFFPETRPFFQEGADFFNTSTRLVHTRTVADPDLAFKVTGKAGRHTFGVFTARDAVTNILVPGTERSRSGSFDRDSTSTVGRYRFDFGGSSTVGGFVTDRRGGGYSSQLAAVDLRFQMTPEDRLAVVVAGSSTDYDGEMLAELDLPESSVDGHLALVDYRHSGRTWVGYANYREIDEGFRADLGFQPQVGTTRWNAGGEFRLNPTQGSFVRGGRFGGEWDRTDDGEGDLLEQEWEGWAVLDLPFQSTVGVGGGVRDHVFEGVEYDQDYQWIDVGIRPSKTLRIALELSDEDHIDFLHNRAANQSRWKVELQANLGRRFRGDLELESRAFDVAEGELFTADTLEARLIYQHSTRTFFRAILQNPRITRNPALHADPVDREDEALFAQLLYSYKLNPQTVLFLGYSDNAFETQDHGLTTADRTVFMKIGYAFLW